MCPKDCTWGAFRRESQRSSCWLLPPERRCQLEAHIRVAFFLVIEFAESWGEEGGGSAREPTLIRQIYTAARSAKVSFSNGLLTRWPPARCRIRSAFLKGTTHVAPTCHDPPCSMDFLSDKNHLEIATQPRIRVCTTHATRDPHERQRLTPRH